MSDSDLVAGSNVEFGRELERDEWKHKLQAFKALIETECSSNTSMLRSDTPKSERRISVLHARIEMLTWVLKQIEELLKA